MVSIESLNTTKLVSLYSKSIDIVLATCNGQNYIESQIDSIINNDNYHQLVNRFIIIDDASNDNTLALISQYATQHISIEVHQNIHQLGVIKNFEKGMGISSSKYIMLSDQDDVWLPSKIIKNLDAMHKVEKNHPDKPCLVFSDKEVVNDKLKRIHASYFQLKKIPTLWYKNLDNLLQQNMISGCTMLFNRALLEKALPIPDNCFMHDWWLVLFAKAYGEIVLINEPLVKYRQHAHNQMGVGVVSWWKRLVNMHSLFHNFQRKYLKIINQAQLFHTQVTSDLYNDQVIEQDFMIKNIHNMSKKQRIKAWKNKDITRSRVSSRLLVLFLLLTLPVESNSHQSNA
ncbi:MAG: glycosyltransferase family 2 protein [Colwellia sp.]|nr:glycosyltransferase family 2 protein [Colwellia sp.]